MSTMHDFLKEQSRMYAEWHEKPHHSLIHFLVLTIIASVFAVSLLSVISQADVEQDRMSAAPIVGVQKGKVEGGGMQGITNQVFRAIDTYLTVEENGKGAALAQLSMLLDRRADMLENLMMENPEAALNEVLPPDILASLPSEIAEKLERHMTLSGEFGALIKEDIEQGSASLHYFLTPNSAPSSGDEDSAPQNIPKRIELKFGKGIPSYATGQNVSVTGSLLRGTMLIAGAEGSGVTGSGTSIGAASSFATGARKVLVVMVNTSDNLSTPYTAQDVEKIMFSNQNSVAKHYEEMSFGKLLLSGVVYPEWVTAPTSATDVCSNYGQETANYIKNTLEAKGYRYTDYQHVMHVYPKPGCQFTGFAWIGGTPGIAWVPAYSGSLAPYFQMVIEHELGHSFGAHHASTLSCGSLSVSNTGCTLNEYGELFDPVGGWNTHNHMNAPHKVGYGWFSNAQTITQSGDYTLAPLEVATTALQTLRFLKPDTNEYYYLSYRQPIGIDSDITPEIMRGATVHVWNGSMYTQTKLLDMTPGDGNFSNGSLLNGSSFTDSANGITVTQKNADASGVTLTVTLPGETCTARSSSGSLTPSSQTTASADGSLTYTISITNNDSSACGSSTYNLEAVMPSGITGSLSVPSLTINPGSNATAQITTKGTAETLNGAYSFSVRATDTKQSTRSMLLSGSHLIFSDTTSPVVKITNPINGARLTGNTTISVSASDNVRVTKVELYVNGKLHATDTSNPYSFKLNTRQIGKGIHTLSVKAYDGAGNTATDSISVTI